MRISRCFTQYILQLGNICLQQLRIKEDTCMLFSTSRSAQECVSFIIRHTNNTGTSREKIRIMHTVLVNHANSDERLWLFVVIFPAPEWKIAKSYWQHAGTGISSRYAEACLRLLSDHNTFSDIRDDLGTVTRQFHPHRSSSLIISTLNAGTIISARAN
jgi:hypothetical protein